MLNQQTIQIIKTTAPILQEHGELLTRHFYQRMFAHSPEVAPFFNAAHQHSGAQQKALAGAICAYAANIDNLEVLGNAVELIAHKHASLQIKPEHYPIVGTHLLASIKEILGESAAPEIIDAWAQAYHLLANILINRESQIYQEQIEMPHGWNGFKSFQVCRKEKESDIITSFYLTPTDGEPLPLFKPGQYITVRIPGENGHTTMRHYSLSNKPGEPYFRISVKRETTFTANIPQGYVSNTLHDTIDVGDTLSIAPPCGEFFLDIKACHDRPLVLLAAGIGITPILSILQSALEQMPNRKIILIYGALHEKVQAFKAILNSFATQYTNLCIRHCYSEPAPSNVTRLANDITGMIDASLIESLIPERNADYYFCGPKPFMVAMYHQLLDWNVPPAQIHFEFFGPREEEKIIVQSKVHSI